MRHTLTAGDGVVIRPGATAGVRRGAYAPQDLEDCSPLTNSYSGFKIARRRFHEPTLPSTTRRVPGSTPGIVRRPMNTSSRFPVPSVISHSRFAVPFAV